MDALVSMTTNPMKSIIAKTVLGTLFCSQFCSMHFFVLFKYHFETGIQQKGAKNVDYPVEMIYQGNARENENKTHNQGAYDAIKEHFMLKAIRNVEIFKYQQEYKKVIHAE